MARARLSLCGVVPPLAAAVLLYGTGLFIYPVSRSIPAGIYRRALTHIITPGDLVRFDGAPYGRTRYVLKYAAAVPGDRVKVTRSQYSGPCGPIGAVLSDIEPPYLFDGRVPPGYVFVAGTHEYSYDSRYYGPVPISSLMVYRPVVILSGVGGGSNDPPPWPDSRCP